VIQSLIDDRAPETTGSPGKWASRDEGAVYSFSITRKSGGNNMNDKNFMSADDVAEELGVSKSFAYKVVQRLNAELREKGYLTVSGRVSRKYFTEKYCYGGQEGGDP